MIGWIYRTGRKGEGRGRGGKVYRAGVCKILLTERNICIYIHGIAHEVLEGKKVWIYNGMKLLQLGVLWFMQDYHLQL